METKSKRGGARPGAGRPRKPGGQTIRPPAFEFGLRVAAPPRPGEEPKEPPAIPVGADGTPIPEGMEPMEFLELVMRGRISASTAQIGAAKALMAYKHKKALAEGKKAEAEQRAREVASRFTRPAAAA